MAKDFSKTSEQEIDVAHQQLEEELPNQCLGKLPNGNFCQTKLPKNVHLCAECKKRIGGHSVRASNLNSLNKNRQGKSMSGIAD